MNKERKTTVHFHEAIARSDHLTGLFLVPRSALKNRLPIAPVAGKRFHRYLTPYDVQVRILSSASYPNSYNRSGIDGSSLGAHFGHVLNEMADKKTDPNNKK